MPFAHTRPVLRPVEVYPGHEGGRRVIIVHDPAGMAEGTLTVTPPGLFIMSKCDGEHGLDEICAAFAEEFGQPLPRQQLEEMLEQLDAARYLEGPRFQAYFQSLVDAYGAAPARCSGDAASFGADGDGLDGMIARILAGSRRTPADRSDRRLVGLIAPHLDYPRGEPCYADAYATLAAAPRAERFIILGTNHFGRATGPVATRKDFQTPLGTTRTDRGFLARLERRCGVDLCEHEFDHQREHSVELQVIMLQQILGAENFQIVPVLCHDPCGPTGTASYDGNGADLRDFAHALGDLIREDPTPTVIIAGADLSHVGHRFGDEEELDETFLRHIEKQDRQALEHLTAGDEGAFVSVLRDRCNSTRVCSAGCIYALLAALPTADVELLRYHQAADRDSGTGVTCCAAALWET